MTLTAQTRRAISSMATRQLLAELVGLASDLGVEWQIESVGGVDAARRVAAGEVFDLVLLASDAIDTLIEAGHLLAGSRVGHDAGGRVRDVAVDVAERPEDEIGANLFVFFLLLFEAIRLNQRNPLRVRISGVVIAFNESEKIGACLRSLQPVCDELIVVDSGCQILSSGDARVPTKCGRVLRHRDRVQIHDAIKAGHFVLHLHPILERAQIIAQMQIARRLHARKYQWPECRHDAASLFHAGCL